MDFSCTAEAGDGRVVLTVSGDVDLAAHARFQAEAEQGAKGPDDVVVDCSDVTFLDSMGLRVLVHLRRMVTEDGRDFALRAPSKPVLRVLELAGVEELFRIVEADADGDRDPRSDPEPVG